MSLVQTWAMSPTCRTPKGKAASNFHILITSRARIAAARKHPTVTSNLRPSHPIPSHPKRTTGKERTPRNSRPNPAVAQQRPSATRYYPGQAPKGPFWVHGARRRAGETGESGPWTRGPVVNGTQTSYSDRLLLCEARARHGR